MPVLLTSSARRESRADIWHVLSGADYAGGGNNMNDVLRFQALASSVALEDCSANLTGAEGLAYMDELWREYCAGSAKNRPRQWLRERLVSWFPCLGVRPRWVGRKPSPQWPWHAGRPMTFAGQLSVPGGRLPTGQEAGKCELFIFVAAEPSATPPAGGWTARYVVVDQDPDFPW